MLFTEDEFKNSFKRTHRTVMAVIIIGGAVSIAVLGFFGWVIVKILAHCDVI